METLPIIVYDSSGIVDPNYDHSLIFKLYEFPLPILDTSADIFFQNNDLDRLWFANSLRSGLHFEVKSITAAGINNMLEQFYRINKSETNQDIPVIYFPCSLNIVNQYNTIKMLIEIHPGAFFLANTKNIGVITNWAINSFAQDIQNTTYKNAFDNLEKIYANSCSFFISKFWDISPQIKLKWYEKILAYNKHAIFTVDEKIKFVTSAHDIHHSIDKIIKRIPSDKKIKRIALINGLISEQEVQVICEKLSRAFTFPIEQIGIYEMRNPLLAFFNVESYGVQILFE